MKDHTKKMIMYYGSITIIGAGIATCWTLSAWGIVPVCLGAGILIDLFI
jgi:hypothetical protein